ncbi:MFS transporter [Brucepastera parasyntrophica]|uniref:MFS transporter n=1 Tax=Brucepastera parasyntrophica TaxID=2880008 RepID=UPI0021093CA9|nr:MFS transporter [Brucepastera parasyntrophica]ULQ60975.1 MFS transporter [Brucepastera parasyntrophica]
MPEALHIGWKNRLAYSSINFGFSLLAMTVSTLMMYYYTDVLVLPVMAVSGILFAVRLFDGLVDPFLGHYMDRRSTKFGKYRGYILYWAIPMCITFVLMFAAVPLTGTVRIIWCLLIYLAFTLSFSFVEIASLPMLASFGNHGSRTACNTWKVFGCIIATLIAVFFSLKLVRVLGQGSELRGYFRMALLFALTVLLAVIIGGFSLREGKYAAPDAGDQDRDFSGLKAILTALKEKRIVFLLCMHLCMDAASAFKMQAGIYYLKYTIERQDMIPLFLVSPILASLLMQPAVFYLAKRFRLCTLLFFGNAVSALAMLLIGLSGSSAALLIGANCLFGMASAFPANLVFSRMAELSDRLAVKHGKPFGGVVNSFLGLASRLGSSFASGLFAFILFITGYVPNAVQTGRTLTGISIGFVILPVIVLILGGLFAMLSFDPFDRKAIRASIRLFPGKAGAEAEPYP